MQLVGAHAVADAFLGHDFRKADAWVFGSEHEALDWLEDHSVSGRTAS